MQPQVRRSALSAHANIPGNLWQQSACMLVRVATSRRAEAPAAGGAQGGGHVGRAARRGRDGREPGRGGRLLHPLRGVRGAPHQDQVRARLPAPSARPWQPAWGLGPLSSVQHCMRRCLRVCLEGLLRSRGLLRAAPAGCVEPCGRLVQMSGVWYDCLQQEKRCWGLRSCAQLYQQPQWVAP